MTGVVLLCTVGGSYEPILSSIRENKPDFVCFICSGKDPVTGKPGSEIQVTGTGRVIKQSRADDKPTLPNIPTQAELEAGQYEVITVSTDDLDAAFQIIARRIKVLTREYPDARLVADYTGGTKSMSAALILAAVENEVMNLRLTTGVRTDLKGVSSGMERVEVINVETVRIQRNIDRFIGSWRWFAYGEAAMGLGDLKPGDRSLADRVRVLQDLSKAFDSWDRFDHKTAAGILSAYGKRIAPTHPHLLASVKRLTTESDCTTPARLWDLWFNALRRAEQGRFDDAIARLYRLLEWTAQWLLQVRRDIDTADIPQDRLPPDIPLQPNRQGRYQAGLMHAWQLIGRLCPNGGAGRFGKEKLEDLQNQLVLRNHSILAHGYQPIGEQDWRKFREWMENEFLALLEAETRQAGLKTLPEQLPREPWKEIAAT